nr:hypothetical protein [Micromonospora sp. DSM 115978]
MTALTTAWQGQASTVLVAELSLVLGEVRRATTAMDDAAAAARDYRRALDDIEDDLDGIRTRRANADRFRDEDRQLAMAGVGLSESGTVESSLADVEATH